MNICAKSIKRLDWILKAAAAAGREEYVGADSEHSVLLDGWTDRKKGGRGMFSGNGPKASAIIIHMQKCKRICSSFGA